MPEGFKKIIDVLEDEASRFIYSYDSSEVKGEVRGVMFPETTEQVEEILFYANSEKYPITPRGAGTSLTGASVPINSFVVDMSRMNKIEKIDPDNKIAVVQAGVTIYQLNKELEKYGLEFPVKPGSHKVCTVAGAISTNAVGIRAVKHGRMSDWVNKVEIVHPGEKAEWKDNKIILGSEGTLGVITRAELKLTEKLYPKSMSILKFNSYKELIDKVKNIKNALSVEFLNKKTSELMNLGNKLVLIVEFEDESGEVKDKKEMEKLAKQRENVYPSLASAGFYVIDDPKIKMEKMEEFLEDVEKRDIPAFGHISIGIIHTCYSSPEKRKEIIEIVKKLDGEVSGEHGIGFVKKGYDAKEELKKSKLVFDKDNIMNREKIW